MEGAGSSLRGLYALLKVTLHWPPMRWRTPPSSPPSVTSFREREVVRDRAAESLEALVAARVGVDAVVGQELPGDLQIGRLHLLVVVQPVDEGLEELAVEFPEKVVRTAGHGRTPLARGPTGS